MRRHRGCRCACVRAWSRPGLVATGGRSSPVADVKLPLQKHLSVVPAWRWPLARESCCPAGACLQPAVAKPLGQLHRNRLASLSTHASSRRGAAAALCRARQAAAPAAAARLSQRGGRGRTRLGLPCPTPALIPAAKHLQRLLASPRVVQLGRQCLVQHGDEARGAWGDPNLILSLPQPPSTNCLGSFEGTRPPAPAASPAASGCRTRNWAGGAPYLRARPRHSAHARGPGAQETGRGERRGARRVGKPNRNPVRRRDSAAALIRADGQRMGRGGARSTPSASGKVCTSTSGASAFGAACILLSTSSGSVSSHCAPRAT